MMRHLAGVGFWGGQWVTSDSQEHHHIILSLEPLAPFPAVTRMMGEQVL